MDKPRRVEELVGELERIIAELEEIAPQTYQAGGLPLEDNCVPGGSYLVLSRTEGGALAIERGQYGRWSEAITLRREYKEY